MNPLCIDQYMRYILLHGSKRTPSTLHVNGFIKGSYCRPLKDDSYCPLTITTLTITTIEGSYCPLTITTLEGSYCQ